MYTNTRSIMNNNKREELEYRLTENCIDILGVTESWTHDDISDVEINIKGYRLFRRDRSKVNGCRKRGGGILLYVKEEFVAAVAYEVGIVLVLMASYSDGLSSG